MSLRRCLFFLIFTLQFIFSSSYGFAGTFPRLEKPPLGERWFGIFVNDERTGFAHGKTTESPAGYEMYSESSEKMTGFVSREATIRETYSVNGDLRLKSFAVSMTINGSPTELRGEMTPSGVRVTIESDGTKKERLLKHKGALYPAPALNLYPLMQGSVPGKRYRLSILDVEALKIREIKTTVIGFENVGGVKAVHLRNNRYPFDTDIWIDTAGNTIKESVRDGWIATQAEDEKTAKLFVSEAALGKKELLLNFSLIKVDTPISRPSELKKMVAELSDFPANARLVTSPVQKAERLEGGRILFTIDNTPISAQLEAAARDTHELVNFLKPSDRILSDNPALMARKAEIVADEKDPKKVTEKLTRWVASHVEETVSDSLSPLETLEKGEGNSQAHVRLYASLARAAGIPTKFVSGLVYIRDKGFLYHCWAESHIGQWLPVDPTFGEVPADATHIKLVEGDSPDDLIALSEFVGKIKAKVIEQKY